MTDGGYIISLNSRTTHPVDFANARLNSRSRILHTTFALAPEPTTPHHFDINSLFTQSPTIPKEEPSAEQLPSVDRLTQLFSRAMTIQWVPNYPKVPYHSGNAYHYTFHCPRTLISFRKLWNCITFHFWRRIPFKSFLNSFQCFAWACFDLYYSALRRLSSVFTLHISCFPSKLRHQENP